jgi:hypothetical protein
MQLDEPRDPRPVINYKNDGSLKNWRELLHGFFLGEWNEAKVNIKVQV